jgi:hypothetical protein
LRYPQAPRFQKLFEENQVAAIGLNGLRASVWTMFEVVYESIDINRRAPLYSVVCTLRVIAFTRNVQ